jgi:periplasmic divalent cation tolerance protein
MTDALLVLTTVGSNEDAERLATTLVGERLAACVNILPEVRSIFRWKGEVSHDKEYVLQIKTTTSRYEAIRRRIRELQTYEVPEIIAVSVDLGDRPYLDWIKSSVGPEGSDQP